MKTRDFLSAPPGTVAKVRRLAEVLAAEKGVPVSNHIAVLVAVEEALARREQPAPAQAR